MIFYSCSPKDRLQIKDSLFISMISLLQVKLPNYTHQMKRKRSLMLSEVKLNQKEKLTPETILTAGTGTLIRLSKNFTCPFVSRQLVNL